MSKQLPEGFTLNYNIPSNPTAEIMEKGSLPTGFELNYNLPSDNSVPVVTKVTPQEVTDPVVTAQGVTVGNYISSKRDELFSALSEDYDESIQEAVKAFEAQGITGAEKALRVTGAGANLALDVIGETVITGLSSVGDAISFIVPDAVENPVKEKFKQGVEFALNSDAGKAGIEAILDGQEAWAEYKERNPRSAENIEAVVDIALLVAPIKGGKVKPEIDLESPLSREARKQVKLGARSAIQSRRQNIVGIFTDLNSSKLMERTRDGVVRLSPMEITAADSLSVTKGFKPKRSATYNLNVLNNELPKLNAQVSKMAVNASGQADIPKFYDDLTKQFDDLVSKSLEPERATKEISRVMEALEGALAKNSNSAKGLLETRKALDAWFTRVKGEEGFNKKGDMVDAVRIARDSINASFDTLVPEAKSLRKKQAGLLFAQEGMAVRAAKEGNALQRATRNIFKAIGTNKDVALAAVGLSGGALAYGSLAAPLTIGAIVGGGAYIAGKPIVKFGISQATSRKNLAVMMKGFDKAIKAAKGSPEMIKQLRADRAAVITYIRDLEEIWESGGKEAFEAEQARQAGSEDVVIDPETGKPLNTIVIQGGQQQ